MNSTKQFGPMSGNSRSGNRASASTGSSSTNGRTPGSSQWQLKKPPIRTTISPAVGAKESINGAKNHVRPLREERHLAHRQSRPRSATSRKHWIKRKGRSRAVPDSSLGKAQAGEGLRRAPGANLAGGCDEVPGGLQGSGVNRLVCFAHRAVG